MNWGNATFCSFRITEYSSLVFRYSVTWISFDWIQLLEIHWSDLSYLDLGYWIQFGFRSSPPCTQPQPASSASRQASDPVRCDKISQPSPGLYSLP